MDFALEIGLTIAVGVVAIIGNVLIVLAVYRNKKLRTSTNLLVLNLALADGLTALFCMPLTASDVLGDSWRAGQVLCGVQGFAMFALGSISIHTITITAINRYCRLLQPNFYRKWITYKSTLIFLVLMWVLLLCASSAAVVSGCAEITYRPGTGSCILRFSKTPEGRAALGLSVVFGFLYPTATMMFCYFKVFQAIRKHNSLIEPLLRRKQSESRIRATRRSKATRTSHSKERVLDQETSANPMERHGRQLLAGAEIKFENAPEAEMLIQTVERTEIQNKGEDQLAVETEEGEIKRRKCSVGCFTVEALDHNNSIMAPVETVRLTTRYDTLESAVPKNVSEAEIQIAGRMEVPNKGENKLAVETEKGEIKRRKCSVGCFTVEALDHNNSIMAPVETVRLTTRYDTLESAVPKNVSEAEIQIAGRMEVPNKGENKLAVETEKGEIKRRKCSVGCFTVEALDHTTSIMAPGETERSGTGCDTLESAVLKNVPEAEIQIAGRADVLNKEEDKLVVETETGEIKRRKCSAGCVTVEALVHNTSINQSRSRYDTLKSAVPQSPAGTEKNPNTEPEENITTTNITQNSESRAEEASNLKTNVDEIRITHILFAVLMGYVLCWFPTVVIAFLSYTPHGRNVPDFVRFLSVWVFYLSCCLNVFIYGIMSRPFRRDILKIICCSQ